MVVEAPGPLPMKCSRALVDIPFVIRFRYSPSSLWIKSEPRGAQKLNSRDTGEVQVLGLGPLDGYGGPVADGEVQRRALKHLAEVQPEVDV